MGENVRKSFHRSEDTLWKTPHQCQLDTPFLRDTIWRFLHRVLPTEANLHRWNLSASPHCIACTSFVPDTIDHAFDACPAWQKNFAHSAEPPLCSECINLTPDTFASLIGFKPEDAWSISSKSSYCHLLAPSKEGSLTCSAGQFQMATETSHSFAMDRQQEDKL